MAINNPYALKFGGTTNVTIPHSNSLSPLRQMTIEFDIKINSFVNTWMPIIYKGNARQYSMWVHSTGRMYLGTEKLDGTQEILWSDTITPVMVANTWYHIAGVINRDTGILKLYLNDALWFSIAITVGVDTLVQPYPLYFGSTTEVNSAYSMFNGYLDNVRMWNIERTLTQIKDNRKKQLKGNENNLIAYWKFNEGNGTTITDVVNGNNGIIVNGTWATGGVDLDPICEFDKAEIIPSNIWTYKNNNDSLLKCTIDTDFGTQTQYKIFINGIQYYPSSGYTLLTTTPYDIQMAIPQSAFNSGKNTLYIDVLSVENYLYRLGTYNVYKEDRDSTSSQRDFDFNSEYTMTNNNSNCNENGLSLIGYGTDIVISNDNSQLKTIGKRKINSIAITGTDDSIQSTTLVEDMETDMIVGTGTKYTYDINSDRFTELNGMVISNGNTLIQTDDKVYTFKGTGYVDIGNQNPTQLDFQNNDVTNLNLLFADMNIARFVPSNKGVLGDGYLYRQIVNLSKYNGVKSAIYSNGIVNFGTYRAWSDGTYAKSAEEYLRPTDGSHVYMGDTGSGIYRIKPTPYDACGIWTLYQDATRYETVDSSQKWIRLKSTSWCGYWDMVVLSGTCTLSFEYKGNGTFAIDNDGVNDNTFNATLVGTSDWQTYTITKTLATSGHLLLYMCNTVGTNTEIRNIKLVKPTVIQDVYCDMNTSNNDGAWMLVLNTGVKGTLTTMATSSGTLPVLSASTTMCKLGDDVINALRGKDLSKSIIKVDRPNNPSFKTLPIYFRQNTPYISDSPRYGTVQDSYQTIYMYYPLYLDAKNGTSTGRYGANATNYGSALSTWGSTSFPSTNATAYYLIMNYSSEACISHDSSAYEGSRSERNCLIWVKQLA